MNAKSGFDKGDEKGKPRKPEKASVKPASQMPASGNGDGPEEAPAAQDPTDFNPGEETDYASDSDEALMKMCQEGDEVAFEILFQRYKGPALSFIYRMIGDRGRTEALGQEAFLRIFRDAGSYQYPRSFSTWFYTIVRNLCKNELRWRSRHPTLSIEESLDRSDPGNPESIHLRDNLRSQTKDPLDRIVSEELNKTLEQALKELPELEREILILKCFQGLKYKEIAEVVSVSVGIVRSRIHAALEKLRKSVKDFL